MGSLFQNVTLQHFAANVRACSESSGCFSGAPQEVSAERIQKPTPDAAVCTAAGNEQRADVVDFMRGISIRPREIFWEPRGAVCGGLWNALARALGNLYGKLVAGAGLRPVQRSC